MKRAITAKIDARRQPEAKVRARRLEVARLHQEGTPVMEIVRRTGLNWATVNTVIKKVQAGGLPALEPPARGRKMGQGRALSCSQERQTRECIRTRPPRFYGLEDTVWTRDSVSNLIQRDFDLVLSRRSVDDYLARWGIELKNSGKTLAMRCTPVIRSWMAEHYREIQAKAEKERAEILFLNKPTILDDKTWSLPNDTSEPISGSEQKGRRYRLISAVDRQGTLRWLVITGPLTPSRQMSFIKGLHNDIKRNLILIRCDSRSYSSWDFKMQITRLAQDILNP